MGTRRLSWEGKKLRKHEFFFGLIKNSDDHHGILQPSRHATGLESATKQL